MNIETVRVYGYDYEVKNFPSPRKSLILELLIDGFSYFAEAAPLPGWSHETLEETLFALEDISDLLLSEELLSTGDLPPLPPSLSFALEMALLSAFHPIQIDPHPTAALFLGTAEEIQNQAAEAKTLGITTAKLKLALFSDDEAHALISKLQENFTLRIDLNQSWSTERVLSFFSKYPKKSFAYLEEPCEEPPSLHHPLALDEKARELIKEGAPPPPGVEYLILKPTLTGGLTACQKYARYAKRYNLSLVLSSSFESDLGLWQIALLSSHLDIPLETSGLGTLSYLNTHLLVPPLRIDEGKIEFPSEIFPNLSLLELIDEYSLSHR